MKPVKKITAAATAVVMAVSMMRFGASAYYRSWSLRHLNYAPTSESCYHDYITERASHMNITKANQTCSQSFLKTGITVTSTIELYISDYKSNYRYGGNFDG